MNKNYISAALLALAFLGLAGTGNASAQGRSKRLGKGKIWDVAKTPPSKKPPATVPPTTVPPTTPPKAKPDTYLLKGEVTLTGSGSFQEQTSKCDWSVNRKYYSSVQLDEFTRSFNVPKMPDQVNGISLTQVQATLANYAGPTWKPKMSASGLTNAFVDPVTVYDELVCSDPGLKNFALPTTVTTIWSVKTDWLHGNYGELSVNNNDGTVILSMPWGEGLGIKITKINVQGGPSPPTKTQENEAPPFSLVEVPGYIGGNVKFTGPIGFLAMPAAGFESEMDIPVPKGMCGWDARGNGSCSAKVKYTFRKE